MRHSFLAVASITSLLVLSEPLGAAESGFMDMLKTGGMYAVLIGGAVVGLIVGVIVGKMMAHVHDTGMEKAKKVFVNAVAWAIVIPGALWFFLFKEQRPAKDPGTPAAVESINEDGTP